MYYLLYYLVPDLEIAFFCSSAVREYCSPIFSSKVKEILNLIYRICWRTITRLNCCMYCWSFPVEKPTMCHYIILNSGRLFSKRTLWFMPRAFSVWFLHSSSPQWFLCLSHTLPFFFFPSRSVPSSTPPPRISCGWVLTSQVIYKVNTEWRGPVCCKESPSMQQPQSQRRHGTPQHKAGNHLKKNKSINIKYAC